MERVRAHAALADEPLAENQHVDIGVGTGHADHLDPELPELAEPAGLRAAVSEVPAHVVALVGRREVVGVPEVRADHAGRALRPQRERPPALVLERVHLLRHHVGGFPRGPREQLGVLERRRLEVPEAEQVRDRVRRLVQLHETVGVGAQDVLRAPGWLELHQPSLRRNGFVARSDPTSVRGP